MNSLLRIIFLVYFITHIPITIFVDLQILFGEHYPESLQQLFAWYIRTYNDQLLRNWIRIPSIIYGAHVATTVWAILAEFYTIQTISAEEKFALLGFYAPYLVIPLLLTFYMAVTPQPFGDDKKKTK
eukprot:gene13818-15891_t